MVARRLARLRAASVLCFALFALVAALAVQLSPLLVRRERRLAAPSWEATCDVALTRGSAARATQVVAFYDTRSAVARTTQGTALNRTQGAAAGTAHRGVHNDTHATATTARSLAHHSPKPAGLHGQVANASISVSRERGGKTSVGSLTPAPEHGGGDPAPSRGTSRPTSTARTIGSRPATALRSGGLLRSMPAATPFPPHYDSALVRYARALGLTDDDIPDVRKRGREQVRL
jgi:hypothetical protein